MMAMSMGLHPSRYTRDLRRVDALRGKTVNE
jgi:hypothetical protein